MKATLLGALCLFLSGAFVWGASAEASVSDAQIKAVAAAPTPDASLPLDVGFQDENGRRLTMADAMAGLPALVVFADYTCRTLCGPVVEFVAAGLSKTGLRPGADYRLVVVGLDPRDGLDAARSMRAAHIAAQTPLAQATVFLSGDEAAIRQATQAAGLHYYYDAEHDQFAHPAAVYVVDAQGRIQRVLSPLGLDGADLRLAIVDAGRGAVGTLADRIHLLCYGYDPVRGVYNERITTMLAYAAAATLVVMAGGIGAMVALEKRRRPP
jgi:protein SCO1